jgi:hypothetical protein
MPAAVNVSCCLLAVTLLAGESVTALTSYPSAPAVCARLNQLLRCYNSGFSDPASSTTNQLEA